jgi:hypothetical protein
MRQRPTKSKGASKKAPKVNNNSSNAQGNRPRKQANARRNLNLSFGGARPQVSVAANYASGQSGRAPKITRGKDNVNIVHRELLSNISAPNSAAFTLSNTFALNPGLAQTFPWLATQAQGWETYRFKKLRFCYYTRTGSTTVGSVILCPDYDAADSQPSNEQIASTFEDVQEDAPWKDIMCPLRPMEMHQPGQRKFVRSQALAANLDIKTYDSGNLFVFTVDSAAAASWGKLWVEYDVDLFTPQSQSSTPVGVAGGSFVAVGGMTGANPLGTSATSNANNQYISVNTSGVITFLKTGTYILGFDGQGSVMSAWSPVLGAGVTNVGDYVTFNSAATNMNGSATITVNSLVGATFGPAMTATTITGFLVDVGSMPFNSSV